jgi:glycosyltransferase involved in cell wall biosynthesis
MKKILFIDGTGGYTPTRLDNKATGGISTSLTIIPRYLAANGWEVYVTATSIPKSVFLHGVKYIKDLTECHSPAVVVCNRNLIHNSLIKMFEGAKFIWWLHDIVDHRYLEDNGFTKADIIVALSEYCKSSYSEFYHIPVEKFRIIPNAVDSKVFYPGKYEDRDPNLFVQASAPIKGTYPIEFTFFNMRRNNPNVKLKMYCSQKLHDLDDTIFSKSMDTLRSAGIEICEPVPQKELADMFRKAWAVLMPNHYPEICSNTLLQAMACGCPVVASNIGSVGEFITHRENGLLTHTFPHDMYLWWADYAKNCIDIMTEKNLHKTLSFNAPLSILEWKTVGEKWYSLVEDLYQSKKSVEHLEGVA